MRATRATGYHPWLRRALLTLIGAAGIMIGALVFGPGSARADEPEPPAGGVLSTVLTPVGDALGSVVGTVTGAQAPAAPAPAPPAPVSPAPAAPAPAPGSPRSSGPGQPGSGHPGSHSGPGHSGSGQPGSRTSGTSSSRGTQPGGTPGRRYGRDARRGHRCPAAGSGAGDDSRGAGPDLPARPDRG
ncbi:hypothetical protein [Cellulomonas taurus]|uniref:hypothetical protein n=1 Tax=Cellulomonas taurus TaxID=2729175 RepID=UPI00197D4FEA|nr:hypothetical protein [Cellulomonas taurus]